uniref:Uncharacterized protein n=1 Tax=Oryza glumipatula TaxID=40148 RepID=A0A0E0AHB3_9ORYZ
MALDSWGPSCASEVECRPDLDDHGWIWTGKGRRAPVVALARRHTAERRGPDGGDGSGAGKVAGRARWQGRCGGCSCEVVSPCAGERGAPARQGGGAPFYGEDGGAEPAGVTGRQRRGRGPGGGEARLRTGRRVWLLSPDPAPPPSLPPTGSGLSGKEGRLPTMTRLRRGGGGGGACSRGGDRRWSWTGLGC